MDWIDEIDTMESMDSCDTSLTQKRSHGSADLNPILSHPNLKSPDMGVFHSGRPIQANLGGEIFQGFLVLCPERQVQDHGDGEGFVSFSIIQKIAG